MIDLRVPFIPSAHIERAATDLLRRYAEWKGEPVKPPIDVDEIVEGYFSLDLEVERLEELLGVGGVLGATWLDDRRVVIDSSIEGKDGRFAFTVAHEAGHWTLHRPLIEADKLALPLFPSSPGATPKPAIICRSGGKKPPAEIQADQFAACLLMPATDVRATVRDLYGDTLPSWDGVEARRQARELDPQLRSLATQVIEAGRFSNCSNETMRYRLLDLNLVRDNSAPQRSLF